MQSFNKFVLQYRTVNFKINRSLTFLERCIGRGGPLGLASKSHRLYTVWFSGNILKKKLTDQTVTDLKYKWTQNEDKESLRKHCTNEMRQNVWSELGHRLNLFQANNGDYEYVDGRLWNYDRKPFSNLKEDKMYIHFVSL